MACPNTIVNCSGIGKNAVIVDRDGDGVFIRFVSFRRASFKNHIFAFLHKSGGVVCVNPVSLGLIAIGIIVKFSGKDQGSVQIQAAYTGSPFFSGRSLIPFLWFQNRFSSLQSTVFIDCIGIAVQSLTFIPDVSVTLLIRIGLIHRKFRICKALAVIVHLLYPYPIEGVGNVKLRSILSFKAISLWGNSRDTDNAVWICNIVQSLCIGSKVKSNIILTFILPIRAQ